MDDLADWLRAQLDEDERIARVAGGLAWYRPPEYLGDPAAIRDSEGERVVCDEGWPSEGQAVHIAEWDPARVLREIDAKRQMIAAYLAPGADPHPGLPCINYEGQCPADYDEYDTCSRHLEANKRRFHSDHVLRLLALPYADRPGYQESWRP